MAGSAHHLQRGHCSHRPGLVEGTPLHAEASTGGSGGSPSSPRVHRLVSRLKLNTFVEAKGLQLGDTSRQMRRRCSNE